MGSLLGIYKSAAKKHGMTLEEWLAKKKANLKWCYFCQNWLPLELFVTDNQRGDGRASACRSCAKIKSLASKHKISLERAKMLLDQTFCDICGNTKGALEIDHNHETDEIRGVLCSSCNSAIGLAKEDINILKSIITYLKIHNGKF